MTLPARYKELFIAVLMNTGNVSQTAAALGINRMTAYDWRCRDPEFAEAWDYAMDVARQGLRERVIETATAMGLGKWEPVVDPDTGEPVLDDDFEPVMRFEVDHVDARVLMKLMDKTMRDEVRQVDQRTIVGGRVTHEHVQLVVYDAEGEVIEPWPGRDADDEATEAEDA